MAEEVSAETILALIAAYEDLGPFLEALPDRLSAVAPLDSGLPLRFPSACNP